MLISVCVEIQNTADRESLFFEQQLIERHCPWEQTVLKCDLGLGWLEVSVKGARRMDLQESTLEDDEMLMAALAISMAEEEERVQKDLSMVSGVSGGSVPGDFAFLDEEDDELQLALAVSLSLSQEEPSQPTKPEGECSQFRNKT